MSSRKSFKQATSEWFKLLQDDICSALEKEDGKSQFVEEKWERPEGGGGRTRIIQDGNVIEKGGVNFSAVEGELPENIAQALKINSTKFFATGVSIVIHPHSPMVPIIHMNVRYFETWGENEEDIQAQWFGGGIDLTPHYVVKDQAKWFHEQLKNTCDQFDEAYYPKFKNWADDYFYIPHRKETRGVGGIFFDRMTSDSIAELESIFEFVKGVGETFAPTYVELMNRNKDLLFSESEKNFQLIRRGRYVEFNLVYDKGTKFGLDTGGRIESILMSLPKMASWQYDPKFDRDSKEQQTLELLVKGIDWV